MVVFSPSLNRSLDRAIAQAEQHGYNRATPEHVLLALIDDPDAMPVMQACNVDLERLRSAVLASMPHSAYVLDEDEPDEALDADEPEEAPDQDEEPIPVEHFQVVLARAIAHARGSEREELNSADVLVSMLERPIGILLNEHGLTRYDVTTFISHGIRKDGISKDEIGKDVQATSRRGDAVDQSNSNDGDATGSLTFEVRILNDNYTPMDFVVYVLEQVFDLEPEEAERVMLQIHREGVGACGSFGREEAEARATRMMDMGREHQHPLRGFVQG